MPGTRSAKVTVRAATVKDLETVVALRVALLREHGDNPVYRRLRSDVVARARRLFTQQLNSPGEVTFLAERGGQPIGILRCVESAGSPLLHPPHYAYVSSVYVLPDERRTGVLRALMEHAEAWAREAGLDEFRLHSVATSTATNSAWDALGFEVVEHLRRRPLGR
jgi:GNAT superfamily N-acetyltransferase